MVSFYEVIHSEQQNSFTKHLYSSLTSDLNLSIITTQSLHEPLLILVWRYFRKLSIAEILENVHYVFCTKRHQCEKSQPVFCIKKLATSKNSCVFSEYSELYHLYEHDNALASCFLPKDNMVKTWFYCLMTKN